MVNVRFHSSVHCFLESSWQFFSVIVLVYIKIGNKGSALFCFFLKWHLLKDFVKINPRKTHAATSLIDNAVNIGHRKRNQVHLAVNYRIASAKLQATIYFQSYRYWGCKHEHGRPHDAGI